MTRSNKQCYTTTGKIRDATTDTWILEQSDRHSMHKLTSDILNSFHPIYVPFSRSFADDRKSDRARPRPVSADLVYVLCMRRTFALARIRSHRTYCKFVPIPAITARSLTSCALTGESARMWRKKRKKKKKDPEARPIQSRFPLFRRSRRRPSREVNCILNF